MDNLSSGIATAVGAVMAAPWAFAAALIFAVVAIWKAIDWAYASRLANKQGEIELLEKRLSQRLAEEALLVSANTKTHAEHPKSSDVAVPPPGSDDESSWFKQESGESSPRSAPNVSNVERYISEQTSLNSIMDLIDGKTSLQADVAVKPYIGQRMVFQGGVMQVTMVGDQVAVAVPLEGSKLIFSYFDPPNEDIKLISIGDVVKIDGLIVKIDSFGFELNDCRRLAPSGK